MSKLIIGISGEKYSGKNTAALVLVERHGFVELSFAAALKHICSEALSLDYRLFEDPARKEQPFPDGVLALTYDLAERILQEGGKYLAIDKGAAIRARTKMINVTFGTPRSLLQFVGTEVFRECVDQQFWLKALASQLAANDKVVITDARFANERDFVRGLSGKTILVRGGKSKPSSDGHASETSLGDPSEYDFVIDNNSTIEELHAAVESCYSIICTNL